MSAAQHTQGPWRVQHDTDIVGTENDPENRCVGLVDVAHVYLRTVPGRTQANARLIAAAPDMLQALQAAVTLADENKRKADERAGFNVGRTPEMQAVYNHCVAVIAKATGQEGGASHG